MSDTDKISSLVRPNILALKPYTSARDEAPGDPGLQPRIMLDANENSFGSPSDTDFSRYPDPHQRRLKAVLEREKGVSSAQMFLGNGSDEAIDLLLRAFVEPGRDNIVLMPPTYGMYAVQARIHGAEIREAALRPDFMPDPAAVRAATDQYSRLLFLCSPNNPTGKCLPETFVLEMLETFPGLVVVDEAYIDFAGYPSWANRLDLYPNLVVLQTLSKAWGLAGLRVGMAFSNPLIIDILNKIKYPYNLSEATIQLATEALFHGEVVRNKVRQILAERMRLATALAECSVVEKVFESDANFLLVRVRDADGLYHHLAENGIIVRNRSREIHCEQCLRITVGTGPENDRLLAAFHSFTSKTVQP